MSFIETIPYAAARGRLRELYRRVAGPDNNVDNILLAHGLRPHTLQGHMALYKAVLHHTGNSLEKHFLETVGVYVSLLNDCGYCVEHHSVGLRRLLGDDERYAAIIDALTARRPQNAFGGAELAGLEYAAKLTTSPQSIGNEDILRLREAGLDDGRILELNQVTAYFAYANRTVLGLGVDTAGDIIGLSPNDSDDPENWRHQPAG